MERGHRTLTVLRKGGKVVTIPLAPRTDRAIDLAIGERVDGPIFLGRNGEPSAGTPRGESFGGWRARPASTSRSDRTRSAHAFITAALDAGVPLRDVQEAASHPDPRTTMR
jgi:integrase/recombinase XerD